MPQVVWNGLNSISIKVVVGEFTRAEHLAVAREVDTIIQSMDDGFSVIDLGVQLDELIAMKATRALYVCNKELDGQWVKITHEFILDRDDDAPLRLTMPPTADTLAGLPESLYEDWLKAGTDANQGTVNRFLAVMIPPMTTPNTSGEPSGAAP